jgi:glyoxylate reductase
LLAFAGDLDAYDVFRSLNCESRLGGVRVILKKDSCQETMKKKFRVFATCDIGEAIEVLRKRGYEVEVYPHPEAPPKKLILEKVKSGVDGLITTLRDPIDAEVFEAGAGKLKVVAQIAVGFDNINRADANRYKVPFTHTADVLTEATAEFAFFMMGTLARKMWSAEHLTREHKWGYWHPFLPFLGDEVTGKTVAVVGTGRIGLAFIKKCIGFDMNVLCYDPAYENQGFVKAVQEIHDLRQARGLVKEKPWIKYVPFEEALRKADFVSVHVPLLRASESATPTYHLFNEKTLRLMKPTAYLVNTSRGPVIDEAALALALRENWIGGAALDVYEKEPLPADSPLRDPAIADRCRLLPHFASAARITRLSTDPDKGMAGRCVQGLIDVVEGNYSGDVTKMPYVVNKEGFVK